MLTMTGKAAAKSDKGYAVGLTDWHAYTYSDNQGEIEIAIEWGLRESRCLVYVFEDAFFKWNDGRSIPKEKQLQIKKNFVEAMDFMGVDVIID